MKTKARDSGTPREHRLSSLFHRVSPGKLLGIYLIARATSFATGCRDSHPAGGLGQPCIDSCNQGSCDNGLYCKLPDADDDPKDGTCVAEPPPNTSNGGDVGNTDEGNCEGPELSPLCPAGTVAYECPTALSPRGSCTFASSTSYSTTYCCPYGSDASDADTIDADAGDE